MTVTFRTPALKRAYESQKVAVRAWGEKIGRRYIQRINVLHASSSARELFAIRVFDFHPLKGDRKGQHALRLDGAWRLIVTFTDREMTVVSVEEVTDHYGD